MPTMMSNSRPVRPLRWLAIVGLLILGAYIAGVATGPDAFPAPTQTCTTPGR